MSICIRDGCDKPLPEIAIAALDPFCSRTCAAAHYNAEWPEPEKVKPGPKAGHGANTGWAKMLEPPSPDRPLTQWQRVRIGRDRLARERLK